MLKISIIRLFGFSTDLALCTDFASGYGWQLMWVIPDLELVVLVLHHNPKDGSASHSLNWEEVESIILPAANLNLDLQP